jgi:hypothetical protein
LKDGFDIGGSDDNRGTNSIRDQERVDNNDGDPSDCEAVGLATTFEKVLDFTYDRGVKEEIDMDSDIGLVTTCLDTCVRKGKDCLAITLQNERGGRQRCFAHDSSAGVDQTDPTASTGVFYMEKICVRK